MSLLDWLLRTTLMVLACLATLALIGALVSVSDGSLGEAFPGRVAPQSTEALAASADAPPAAASSSNEIPAEAGATARVVTPAIPPRPPAIERWLKALTYAVLALAGFAAAGVVALLRIGTQLSRIAER
jgi:hypothetical protein